MDRFSASVFKLGLMEMLTGQNDSPHSPANAQSAYSTGAGVHSEAKSIRGVAVFLGILVFFYNMAGPLMYRKKSWYYDLRLGVLIWLFTAALTHTPFGSSKIEDSTSLMFLSVFILLLIMTHFTLAAFTLLHHITAGIIGIFSPSLAETLWAPALRSVQSFKTILKMSVLLSITLSTIFAYCETLPVEQEGESGSRNTSSFVSSAANLVCGRLMPPLDDYARRDRVFPAFRAFGFDMGRFSLLESPIGLLWMSGVALFATYYTLRRTKKVNERLRALAKARSAHSKRTRTLSMQEGPMSLSDDSKCTEEDICNEDSEEEYGDPQNFEGVADKERREYFPTVDSHEKAPKNFLPMTEWYSVAVTETAFQLLVAMKLFLGRFDMRTMLVAISNRNHLNQENLSSPKYLFTRDGVCTVSNSTLRNEKLDERVPNSPTMPDPLSSKPSATSLNFETQFSGLDEMWFDWIADTGDGGNSTYAIARALAQPELELETRIDTCEDMKDSNDDARLKPRERLKRGQLLLIGGDLAYPSPTKEEYDRRLFVPFEYAMEPPSSYRRDDISLAGTQGNILARKLRVSVNTPSPNMRRSIFSSSALNHKTSYVYPDGDIDRSPKSGAQLKRHGQSSSLNISSPPKLSKIEPSLSLGEGGIIFENPGDAYEEDGHEEQQHANEKINSDSDQLSGPPCVFAIPGNHDWFDGLDTFMQCICYRDWLGGWRLPQTRSYFAIQLPHGWWVFAFDLGLEEDIDGLQYQYFAHVANTSVKTDDQVILCTHEPTWLQDAYVNQSHPEEEAISTSAKKLKQLVRRHLRGKVAMRIAGDIHNYMRHNAVQPLNSSGLRAGASPVLVVSGGGGAFVHPTHCFPSTFKETGANYSVQNLYPSAAQSRKISMKNLGQGFRIANWRFDIVISTVYFLMVASFFPRCKLNHIMDADVFFDGIKLFFSEVFAIFVEVFSESVVSFVATIFMLFVCYFFAEGHCGRHRRAIVGCLHFAAHLICAISMFLLLELVVEMFMRDGMVGHRYDSFFHNFQQLERRTMPKEFWSTGNVVPLIKTISRIFDLPENMATTRSRICSGKVMRPTFWGDYATQIVQTAQKMCGENLLGTFGAMDISAPYLSRFEMIGYYLGNFLYMYIVAADIASFVLGLYLYIGVNMFHWHYNEAFSSVRVADFKSFCRFFIDRSGDLHVYVVGIDRVPRNWVEDRNWVSSWTRLLAVHFNNSGKDIDELDPSIASFGAKRPSRWVAQPTRDPVLRKKQEPYILDYFTIPRKSSRPMRKVGSVLEPNWWEAFGDLEQRKVIRKTTEEPIIQ